MTTLAPKTTPVKNIIYAIKSELDWYAENYGGEVRERKNLGIAYLLKVLELSIETPEVNVSFKVRVVESGTDTPQLYRVEVWTGFEPVSRTMGGEELTKLSGLTKRLSRMAKSIEAFNSEIIVEGS